MEKKPYVISAELDLLGEDSDSVIDGEQIEGFRESLDADLRDMGKQTEWVGSNEIQEGLITLINRTKLPVISLDDRYIKDADTFLGISRGIDDELNDVGYVPRVGYPSISDQIDKMQVSGTEAIVADDVVFSGEMLVWLKEELLRRRKIKIVGAIAGIAIGEGIERLNDLGMTVEAVRSFDAVDDELCERDQAVVPGSGRRNDESNVNVLYFDPIYGRPKAWASISGDKLYDFAANSYERSARIIKPGVRAENIGTFKGIDGAEVARLELLNIGQRFR